MEKKTFTRYVPAGMILRHNDICQKQSTISQNASPMQNSPEKRLTAPKSICRNRNIPVPRATQQLPVNDNPTCRVKGKNVQFALENETVIDSGDSDLTTDWDNSSDGDAEKQIPVETTRDENSVCREEAKNIQIPIISKKVIDNGDSTTDSLSDVDTNNQIQVAKTQDSDTLASTDSDVSKQEKNLKINLYEKLKKRKNFKTVTNCSCDNCDKFMSCVTWCDDNIKFESTNPRTKKGPPLLTTVERSKSPIKKIWTSTILVHGVIIPKPVESIKDTYFSDHVLNTLTSMNCSTPKKIQRYMWPSIQRGLNVVMVGSPQSGKTLSYLPAMCTFAFEKNGRYEELSKYEGPLVLILCPNCDKLKTVVENFSENDISVEILTHITTDQVNCDILVISPSILEDSLKSGSVKLRRLCHLVMEDCDLLLKDHHEQVGRFLKIVNRMQTNRPHNKCIQVVLSTETWSVDIDLLVKKIHVRPVIVFENYLQAAIYSNINIVKKKVNASHKKFKLDDILRKDYSTHRSIVFCHEHEIAEAQEYLEMHGVECILISNDLIEDEIFENEDMWCSLKRGRFKVLICTDSLFEKTLRIANAEWLVHYSLPSSWDKFRNRFRCFGENLGCPLETPGDTQLCSYLLVDERSEDITTNFFNVVTKSHIKHLQLH